MLAVQLGASPRVAWSLLVGCIVSCLVFGLIWATQRDWVAAAFCVAAFVGTLRLGLVLHRRHRLQTRAGMVAYGRTFSSSPGGRLFVTFGHYTLGARLRRGIVLIGPVSAAFVPIGGWTHLAWEAVKAPFVARFRFVDIAIDLADDGDVDAALHDAVARHDGFIIDQDWTYTHSQRWLSRSGVQGLVWLERGPPDSIASRWAPAPPPSAERYRWIRNRVAVVAGVTVFVLGLGGVVAWRLTGDADYLVAGLAYGVLLAGSVMAGVVLAKRRIATDAAAVARLGGRR